MTRSETTPTTEQVRSAYAHERSGWHDEFDGPDELAEFDRWLAAHDAEVRAADREAVAEEAESHDGGIEVATWLREKAKEARDGK